MFVMGGLAFNLFQRTAATDGRVKPCHDVESAVPLVSGSVSWYNISGRKLRPKDAHFDAVKAGLDSAIWHSTVPGKTAKSWSAVTDTS